LEISSIEVFSGSKKFGDGTVIIIHLSSASFDSGAGIAVLSLHKSMLAKGIDSRLYSPYFINEGAPESVFSYPNKIVKLTAKLHYWFDRLLIKSLGYKGSSYFSLLRRGRTWPGYHELKNADIIHLHWVGNSFINLRDLEGLKAKFVWTMRDWWPLSGGWHVPFKGYQLFRDGPSYPFSLNRLLFNLAAREQFKKASFLKNTPKVNLVAQSNYMREEAEKTLDLLPGSVTIVPSNVDDIYKYTDKKSARERLGLPLGASLIAVGATNVNDAYKGMHILREIPEKSRLKGSLFLVFGGGKVSLPEEVQRVEYGFVSPKIMRDIYAASDILLCPSIFECFGKVVLESMICGTPAIAFDGTGPAEIIERARGGSVAIPNDPASFFREAEKYLGEITEDSRRDLAQRAQQEYSAERVVRQYINLYHDLLRD